MVATVAVLYPRQRYERIAESYASWRTQSRLRHAEGVGTVVFYDSDDRTADLIDHVDEPYVLVVVDPLIEVDGDIVTRLKSHSELVVARNAGGEPLLYFCASADLAHEKRSPRQALEGRATTDAPFAMTSWRPAAPPDLEAYIPTTVRSLLHVACGDGALGERIRQRQKCRVVGIESRREVAALAKRRLDDVYTGDLDEVISILQEQFECILANGIVEHSVDPWSFLASLRRLAKPDGLLILSIPNVANARVIADLMAGRFATAESVRYFTRESIVELIDISGWTIDTMEAERGLDDPAVTAQPAGPKMSDDLRVTRFHVVARNRRA